MEVKKGRNLAIGSLPVSYKWKNRAGTSPNIARKLLSCDPSDTSYKKTALLITINPIVITGYVLDGTLSLIGIILISDIFIFIEFGYGLNIPRRGI
jgi:hypothetical protein